jgi:uncharacterized protein (TIGR00661 family)
MTRVLIAPLDWGLGHATRCIPIVRELQKRGCEIFLAGSGDSILLLTKEFPNLKWFTLPGYQPAYPVNGKYMPWKMGTQIPKFFRTISTEHEETERIIREHKIDFVISDNRYGCWSDQVPSVFITHQSNILMPKRFGWMSGMVRKMNTGYMEKFSECWIPDYPGDRSLAGKLAEFGDVKQSVVIKHIGPLSRFENSGSQSETYDVLAIFSGPEPQRSLLEKAVYAQLKNSGLNYFVVRGKVTNKPFNDDPRVVNYLNSADLEKLICLSKVIIARSGYSTVMDMAALEKKVIFIPTPGQTEQEYLAMLMNEKKVAYSVSQDEFQLTEALEKVRLTKGFTGYTHQHGLVTQAIDQFIARLKPKPTV